MHLSGQRPIFENRFDAGHQLAAKLTEYKDKSTTVLAIPNGGVLVALGVALELEAELNLVISRKIPLPLSPEGGFGAVTADGTIILNAEMVERAGLSQHQINYQVSRVRADIKQRSLLYRREIPPAKLSGKTAIIVDDGLASGYTMMAAVESIRHTRPERIVVAVPVASATALPKVEKTADRVITCVAGFAAEFYVSDFFRYWHEPGDDEVIQCFKEWRMRRRPQIERPERKTVPEY